MGKIKYLLLLSALIGPAAAQPFNPLVPATTATIALPTSTQAITKLISGVANKYTYITAVHVVTTPTSAVVTWSYGTGTNCGTGTVIMDGPATITPNGPFQWGNGAGALMIAPQGVDVCLTVASQAIAGSVAYGQF